MKNGPDISRIAALIGDPARANMLTGLMAGRALTASELAQEAGVTAQTASSHLARLVDGGLIRQRSQGRHRYAELASPDVAAALEALMGLAAGSGQLRRRPGPRDPALRRARVCYDHLAGEMGTRMFDRMLASGQLSREGSGIVLTAEGKAFLSRLGIDHGTGISVRSRAPACRECLDWSERKSHLGGRQGRAILAWILAQGWASRDPDSRAIRFTSSGESRFDSLFGG